MQDILDIIQTRRSIKKYNSQNVSEQHLKKILEAARWSPSARNKQVWKFIIVKDKNIKKEIGDTAKYYFYRLSYVSNAPIIIVVCADIEKSKWAIIDCAMASQNILLEAHSLGLGTCFIGAFNEAKIKNVLSIPERMKIVGLITLGYPDEISETPPRLEIDEFVFYDVYEQKKESVRLKDVLRPRRGLLSIITKFLKR